MLDALFSPRSVAVVGASADAGKVGYGVLSNLLGKSVLGVRSLRFSGKIYAVNPKEKKILGVRCYPSVVDIPGSVDLAIVCVPAKFVLHVLQDCAVKNVRAAVIISAGFSESGAEGRKLQEEVAALAKRHHIRILGPNCLGFMRPASRLNASFAPVMPSPGVVGLISQSGALIDSILDWSLDHDFGMSAVLSVGNQADITITDAIKALGKDSRTKVIALYIESLRDGRAFIDAARTVSRKKPIIAIKAGKTPAGGKAVSSHTGNLAGEASLYSAAFAQAGIIEVQTIEDLLLAADTLGRYPRLTKLVRVHSQLKKGVVIITNGGGCGVLCADDCFRLGVPLAPLEPKTLRALDSSGLMHPAYSRNNPLDIVGDALPQRYSAALSAVLAQKNVSGAIVIQTLQTMTDPTANAKVVVDFQKKYPLKPILCVFLGGKFTAPGVAYLEKHGVKNYSDVRDAAFAFSVLL